jgi:hypothetical protein
MMSQSYHNAQFFADGRQVRREPTLSRLSVEASILLRHLCISIALCVTCLAVGEAGEMLTPVPDWEDET